MKKTLSFSSASVAEKSTLAQVSLSVARISSGTAVAFLVLLTALHAIKTELDPSWRFISEYDALE